jgi:copper homeostasis protein
VKVALEVCVETLDDAHIACECGADRLEICSTLSVGGVTPSLAMAQMAVEETSLECVALVRPRAGDFLYSARAISVMVKNIEKLAGVGVRGVALGALRSDGRLDREALRDLLEAAHPMYGVLHRAFDETIDLEAALETAVDLGFRRILTSGGKADAPTGVRRIADLVQRSAGRIEILPGGGVRSSNVLDLVRSTGVHQVHSSAGGWDVGWRLDSSELQALVGALRTPR